MEMSEGRLTLLLFSVALSLVLALQFAFLSGSERGQVGPASVELIEVVPKACFDCVHAHVFLNDIIITRDMC